MAGQGRLFSARRSTREGELGFLIQKLDGIRAFRRSNPQMIEDCFYKLYQEGLWNRIRKDVRAIAFFPNTIPQIGRLIKIAQVLRMFFPLATMAIIFAVVTRFGILPVLNRTLYFIMILIPALMIGSLLPLDLIIRRKVIKYQGARPDLFFEEKERIKGVVDELAIKLAVELKHRRQRADQYVMYLYFDDYKAMEILGEKPERMLGIIKKRYTRFKVVPSPVRKR
jgi:hypothetical protein